MLTSNRPGFANTILPFIINSSAYLIIPYSRPVVLVIQALPALAAKLLFPHIRHIVPYWFLPILFSFGWIATAIVAYYTPPNVTSALRILTVVLASVISAAGDIFWLGLLRYYGKIGLQGWGMGTGSGMIVCAVMPYILTVVMGKFLRSGITYAYYLVPVMLLAHWFVLPPAPKPRNGEPGARFKPDGHDGLDEEESASLIIQDSAALPVTMRQRFQSNIRLLSQLVSPFILPLVLGSAGQAMTYAGFSRAMASSPYFSRYTTYLAIYGFIFQSGNLIGRSSMIIARVHKTKVLIVAMVLGTCLVLLNAVFLFVSTPVIVFPLVFAIGTSVGLVYIETFAAAVEDKTFHSGADREFALGTIGVGEPAGLWLGGLIGSLLESSLCGMQLGSGQRWCDTTT